jgi:hypothetical protein
MGSAEKGVGTDDSSTVGVGDGVKTRGMGMVRLGVYRELWRSR